MWTINHWTFLFNSSSVQKRGAINTCCMVKSDTYFQWIFVIPLYKWYFSNLHLFWWKYCSARNSHGISHPHFHGYDTGKQVWVIKNLSGSNDDGAVMGELNLRFTNGRLATWRDDIRQLLVQTQCFIRLSWETILRLFLSMLNFVKKYFCPNEGIMVRYW